MNESRDVSHMNESRDVSHMNESHGVSHTNECMVIVTRQLTFGIFFMSLHKDFFFFKVMR